MVSKSFPFSGPLSCHILRHPPDPPTGASPGNAGTAQAALEKGRLKSNKLEKSHIKVKLVLLLRGFLET